MSIKRVEAVGVKVLGLEADRGLTQVLNMPNRAAGFVRGDEWKAMCERLVQDRWTHLLLALNAKSFEEKEYERGFVDALQYVMELPSELFKGDDDSVN